MATISGYPSALQRERRFFLMMAIAIAVTTVAGFSLDVAAGRATFAEFPWQVHAHAIVFASWIVLYVVQTWLVVAGRTRLHRTLGVWGTVHAAIMVPLGVAATLMAIQRGGVPPFFPPGIFLVLDVLGIVVFGGLVAASIAMRRRHDWHKRLMLSANILVMSPALGRLLPMPLLGAFAPLAVFVTLGLYLLAAIVYDLLTRGRVHPAYWCGAGVITAFQLSIAPLGFSAPVQTVVAALTP